MRGDSHVRFLGRLSREARPTRHFFLAVWPVACIWITSLGISTMAFNLNGFVQRLETHMFIKTFEKPGEMRETLCQMSKINKKIYN